MGERARDLLGGPRARRDPGRTCPPNELRRLLADRRLPVHESVLRFEEDYGGIVLEGEDGASDLELGCFARLSELAPDSGSAWCERDGEILITIGRENTELCMGARGDVCAVGTDDAVIDLATSFETLLEARAIQDELPRWCPTFLRVDVRPNLGDRLASALGLLPVEEASDASTSWWAGDGYRMAEHYGRNDARRGCSYLWAASMDRLAAAVGVAHSIQPVHVAVVARGWRREVVRGAERALVVAPKQTSPRAADALVLPYGSPGDYFTGLVEVRASLAAPRIEQYRYRGDTLVGWDSFSDDERVTRTLAAS